MLVYVISKLYIYGNYFLSLFSLQINKNIKFWILSRLWSYILLLKKHKKVDKINCIFPVFFCIQGFPSQLNNNILYIADEEDREKKKVSVKV